MTEQPTFDQLLAAAGTSRSFEDFENAPDVFVLADQPLPRHQDAIGAIGRRPGKPIGHCIRETFPHRHPKLGGVRMYQAWCGAYVVPAKPVTPWAYDAPVVCQRCVRATAWMRDE